MFTGCTFVRNDAPVGGGLYIESTPRMLRCIVAFSTRGEAISTTMSPFITCCDLFGNAAGDWIGTLAGELGEDGNISTDPMFCDLNGSNFRLRSDSPCLPGRHPDGDSCGLMGALPVGCPLNDVNGESASETRSFGVTIAGSTPGHAPVLIQYYLPSPACRIEIVSAGGRSVATQVAESSDVGRFAWDGRDEAGLLMPVGMYFAVVWEGTRNWTHRFVLLR